MEWRDVVVLGNVRNEMTQITTKLLEASTIMGLEVNKEKEYMYISRNYRNNLDLLVGSYSFKNVSSYKYLEANTNNKIKNKNVCGEIQERIGSANKCYYSLLGLFRSKLLSRESKTTYFIHEQHETSYNIWMRNLGYHKR